MYDIGPEALRLITRAHGVTGRLLASVNGSAFSYPVVMESASVSVNGNQAVRRKLDAVIKAQIDSPECDVFRTEIRAEYGVILADQRVIWIPVGVFVVTDAQEQGGGKISIKGEDRWRRVVNARFLYPEITSGSITAAIINFMQDADQRITCVDKTGSTANHNRALWERDRAQAVLDLTKSLGAKTVFLADGTAAIVSAPDPAKGKPAWIVGEGEGGALIESRRGTSQGNTYNAVVAEGERPDGNIAVRAIATIDNEKSPILFGGPFASRPRYYRSALITTQGQAQSTANAMLLRVSGISRTLELDSFVHPGLDADDIIEVEVDTGVWEKHVVDSFTIQLGPGGTTIQTRTPFSEADEEGD